MANPGMRMRSRWGFPRLATGIWLRNRSAFRSSTTRPVIYLLPQYLYRCIELGCVRTTCYRFLHPVRPPPPQFTFETNHSVMDAFFHKDWNFYSEFDLFLSLSLSLYDFDGPWPAVCKANDEIVAFLLAFSSLKNCKVFVVSFSLSLLLSSSKNYRAPDFNGLGCCKTNQEIVFFFRNRQFMFIDCCIWKLSLYANEIVTLSFQRWFDRFYWWIFNLNIGLAVMKWTIRFESFC